MLATSADLSLLEWMTEVFDVETGTERILLLPPPAFRALTPAPPRGNDDRISCGQTRALGCFRLRLTIVLKESVDMGTLCAAVVDVVVEVVVMM
jgi:hypothetical protein